MSEGERERGGNWKVAGTRWIWIMRVDRNEMILIFCSFLRELSQSRIIAREFETEEKERKVKKKMIGLTSHRGTRTWSAEWRLADAAPSRWWRTGRSGRWSDSNWNCCRSARCRRRSTAWARSSSAWCASLPSAWPRPSASGGPRSPVSSPGRRISPATRTCSLALPRIFDTWPRCSADPRTRPTASPRRNLPSCTRRSHRSYPTAVIRVHCHCYETL